MKLFAGIQRQNNITQGMWESVVRSNLQASKLWGRLLKHHSIRQKNYYVLK